MRESEEEQKGGSRQAPQRQKVKKKQLVFLFSLDTSSSTSSTSTSTFRRSHVLLSLHRRTIIQQQSK